MAWPRPFLLYPTWWADPTLRSIPVMGLRITCAWPSHAFPVSEPQVHEKNPHFIAYVVIQCDTHNFRISGSRVCIFLNIASNLLTSPDKDKRCVESNQTHTKMVSSRIGLHVFIHLLLFKATAAATRFVMLKHKQLNPYGMQNMSTVLKCFGWPSKRQNSTARASPPPCFYSNIHKIYNDSVMCAIKSFMLLGRNEGVQERTRICKQNTFDRVFQKICGGNNREETKSSQWQSTNPKAYFLALKTQLSRTRNSFWRLFVTSVHINGQVRGANRSATSWYCFCIKFLFNAFITGCI